MAEEEPEKHAEEYVNNARNEPDKLVIEVIMSDVYTDNGNLTKRSTGLTRYPYTQVA